MDPNGAYDSSTSNNTTTISNLSPHGSYSLTVQTSAKPFNQETQFPPSQRKQKQRQESTTQIATQEHSRKPHLY